MAPTPHLTDAALAAALDPAGGGTTGAAASAHAAECAECGVALAAARAMEAEIAGLLQELDHPVPVVDVATIAARATEEAVPVETRRAGSARQRVTHGLRPREPGHARWGRWSVAGIILGAAAVAAAVVPNSPVHRLVQRVLAEAHAGTAVERPVLSVPPSTATPRGVAIAAGQRVEIAFLARQQDGVIHVVPGAPARISIRATGDGAAYVVAQDGIDVDNRGVRSLDYTVELPPASQCGAIRIVVAGQLVYHCVNGQVLLPVTGAGDGWYDIPLGGR